MNSLQNAASGKIIDHLQQHFDIALTEIVRDGPHPRVHVNAGDWRRLAEFLRRDSTLMLDWLACLSGVDYAADGQMCAVYDLRSFELRHAIAVKVFTPREAPAIPSVCDLWPAANWQEREAFDLLGMDFPGHPDLRRILCADDWVGHPLRKDYEFPTEYDGIPANLAPDWEGVTAAEAAAHG